jgi:hypothetical protein
MGDSSIVRIHERHGGIAMGGTGIGGLSESGRTRDKGDTEDMGHGHIGR